MSQLILKISQSHEHTKIPHPRRKNLLVRLRNKRTFVDATIGVIAFTAASILKDSVNRIGDLFDDGKPNQSFKS